MEALVLDLRHATRRLLHAPARAAVAVGVVAISVAVAVSTWSAVRGTLLRPLPYENAERLVVLSERHEEKGIAHREVAPARFVTWREEARSFAGLEAYHKWGEMTLGAGAADEAAEVVTVVPVTPGFLSLLGLRPSIGRDLGAEDFEGEGARVALLGHRLWQRRFGADREVVGRTIRLQGELHTVIGVLPPSAVIAGVLPLGAEAVQGEEVVVPMTGIAWQARVYGALDVIGRLAPGVTVEEARAELASLAAAQALEYPGTDEGWSVEVRGIRRVAAGALGPVLALLLIAVLAVHLLACGNLAGLFLSAQLSRSREAAMRAALGASRARLRRLVLFETATVSVAGAAVGLLAAVAGARLLPRIASLGLPAETLHTDSTSLIVSAAIGLATALLVGMPAAVSVSRLSIAESVRGGALTSGGRTRGALVVVQMALAALLLCGAAVTVRTLGELGAVDPGFEPDRVLTLRVDLPRWRYEDGAARRRALAGLLGDLSTLPGVDAVGAVNQAPLGGVSDSFRLWLPGRAEQRPIDLPTAEIRTVSGRYLEALGIPLLRGRGLSGTLADSGPNEAVVNGPLAAGLWPGEDPIGRRLSVDGPEGPWLEVVGVLAEVRHFGVEREAPPELYVPYRQIPWPSVVLALRSRSPDRLVEPVLDRLRAFDPELAAYEVATLQSRLDEALGPRRLPAVVLSLFGVGGVLVAALGLYAVLAYGVAARAREIGLRMAVGARDADIARVFLTGGLRLAALGLLFGLAAGWAAVRVAQLWLDGLRPLDLSSVLVVVLICLGVGVAAALGPSLRAARHDPSRVLRS